MAQFGYKNVRVYADVDRKYQRISHCIWELDDEIVAGKPLHEWVRTLLIEWRLKEKVGPDVIAKRLTQAGIPTPRGRTAWSDSSVNYILMPDKLLQYAGFGIWNRRDYRSGGRTWKDSGEWKVTPNAHPAIISEEEAEAIHAVREQRACRPGKRGRRPSPFVLSGGLLACAHCGANYAGRARYKSDYYVCGSQIYRDGADCTRPWYIRREDVERAAFDCVESVLAADSKHSKRIIDSYNKWAESQHTLHSSAQTARQSTLDRLNQEIRNLTESLAAGVDPKTISAAVNERSEHIARLEALGDPELPRRITAAELSEQAKEIRQIAESSDPSRKRTILGKYVATMKADPEKRTIRVMVHPLSSLCGHSMVAPKGFGSSADRLVRFRAEYRNGRFRDI